jgi:hypothetical protein
MNKKLIGCMALICIVMGTVLGLMIMDSSRPLSVPTEEPTPIPTEVPEVTPEPKPPEPTFRDKAEALFNENNIIIIYGKLSISNNIFADTGLMKLQLNDFLAICKQKGISTIFFYDGHLFGIVGRGSEGAWRHSWYWYFIDDGIIYYVRYEYRFGP